MVIFHCYVSSPEGTYIYIYIYVYIYMYIYIYDVPIVKQPTWKRPAPVRVNHLKKLDQVHLRQRTRGFLRDMFLGFVEEYIRNMKGY